MIFFCPFIHETRVVENLTIDPTFTNPSCLAQLLQLDWLYQPRNPLPTVFLKSPKTRLTPRLNGTCQREEALMEYETPIEPLVRRSILTCSSFHSKKLS